MRGAVDGRVSNMNGRDLVRSWWPVGGAGAARGLRTVRAAWRRRGADATGPGPVRARVPGTVREVEPGPGGGVIRFARSELRILVAVNGAVFWGWDGAGPEPSYALAGACPEPDPRAELEPDTDGGWRVVAERVTVAVSRHGALEVLTPGGVMLRRDLPPRWWEAADGVRRGGCCGRRFRRTPASSVRTAGRLRPGRGRARA